MSQQSKNQLLFGKSQVEDRFVNESQYDGANVPQVVTGGSNNFLDNLSDDVLKQLDEITIIANKQILEKPEWTSFSDFSGNGDGGSTTTTTTAAVGVPQYSPSSSTYVESISTYYDFGRGTTYLSVDVDLNIDALSIWYNLNAPANSKLILVVDKNHTQLDDYETIFSTVPITTDGLSFPDNYAYVNLRVLGVLYGSPLPNGTYEINIVNVDENDQELITLDTFTVVIPTGLVPEQA